MIPLEDGLEAREWLKEQAKSTGLLLNRFKTSREALDFVEKLYAVGAEKVSVSEAVMAEGQRLIQNALAVKCPSDKVKAQIIYDMCLIEQECASVNNELEIYIDWDC